MITQALVEVDITVASLNRLYAKKSAYYGITPLAESGSHASQYDLREDETPNQVRCDVLIICVRQSTLILYIK